MDDAPAMEPVEATQPTVAMEPVTGTEPCPHCGTPLALDQRYCLECGAPRTYLSGMLLERLRSPAGQPATPNQPVQSPPPNGVAFGAPSSPGWQRGNTLTLIAGIGVLLLAMGVGVLIGRSGSSSSTPSAAPQVITVPAAASTTTTPTTPEETSTTAKSGAAAGTAAKHKAKAAEESSGVGSSPSKPAPPSVLKGLGKGSGASNEQKSKNLPNVVSTG